MSIVHQLNIELIIVIINNSSFSLLTVGCLQSTTWQIKMECVVTGVCLYSFIFTLIRLIQSYISLIVLHKTETLTK